MLDSESVALMTKVSHQCLYHHGQVTLRESASTNPMDLDGWRLETMMVLYTMMMFLIISGLKPGKLYTSKEQSGMMEHKMHLSTLLLM